MKYTKERLTKALELNRPVKAEYEAKLEALIAEANKSLADGKLPKNEDKLKEAKGNLLDICEWVSALELLHTECDTQKQTLLADEQVKRALCKARSFTTYAAKMNQTTKRYVKDSVSADYNIPAILTRLGIDMDDLNATLGALTLAVAMTAASDTGADTKDILPYFTQDENVKKKLDAGADFTSKRTMCRVIQDAVNAFLPEAQFKAINHDANFFILAGTKLDKRTRCGIQTGKREEIKKIFFDYVNNLLIHDGVAAYTVTYKPGKDRVREYASIVDTPEIEEPEAPAAEPAAAKPVEEPKSEASAAEPVAAKPEPKSKRGSKKSETAAAKEPKSKRGSKKSEEAAA